ncbi:beta-1,6-N-acetylglucosaminyltransferase [Niabella yanshanensis]|uniref:Peptide O-xylosyltransferase n=1 Tax=Niabella yanshanensis TaxID=577386 RepID=A0ABZ0W8R2_9BACT|nr:beta-1,6-N-acetylglucosaminyltransferase [Niabella yanshanensis]WQD39652.1 beta-1,6-N-acetylglucosaminyltransferase [Niabella yanshanensis]
MNICHLIIAHNKPEQVARLAKSLRLPGSDIYVHVDKKTDINAFTFLESQGVRFVKKRVKVNWGGYSLVEAIVSSLEEIRDGGKPYEFINLLSAQDYPIKKASDFTAFLQENKGKCFIFYEDVEGLFWWKENIVRLTRYHFNDFPVKGKYMAQRLVNFLLPTRKFPMNWKLYGGSCSTWWTLPAEAAYFLAHTIGNNRKLRRFAKLTWGADEYLFATILMNSDFKSRVVNNNYRFIDWSEKNPRPKLLTIKDLQAISASESFFARKFDESVDAYVLDKLDELLAGKDHRTG